MMELTYQFNKEIVQITETPNEVDIEFDIVILSEPHWKDMKDLQKIFEENKIYTDVLFYPYENHHYRVIVRRDFYTDFILGLMKRQLLNSVAWA